MTGTVALKALLVSTQQLLKWFLTDLSDADLQVAPVPGANNIAWQLGHLIASEVVLGQELGGKYPELPPVFKELQSGASSKTRPDGGGLSVASYLQHAEQIRNATLAAVDAMTDADLDKPNLGPMKDFAPKLGDLVIMLGNHTMMHAGQFTTVRRALGKPVLF